jgi:2-polyprenyl-3-methyl-5-hydroxy-6-metoxy-1,4-benzoquinol methylase
MSRPKTNPEIDQNRVEETVETFNQYDYIMFRQQRLIYHNVAQRIRGARVIEAGCGMGLGTAMLERHCGKIYGTDKLSRNCRFASCLYPWIEFSEWDINYPLPIDKQFTAAVAVEVIEHVQNPELAIRNLLSAVCEGGEIWISTPNANAGKEQPPTNPFHVAEYTVVEFHSMLPDGVSCDLFSWDTFDTVPSNTEITPIVYRLIKQ